ncbi:MAG: ABC transporter permease subunit [Clostridia bacterium]|nr:ABC transporter permease subunit [Clostridia bacterium]
MKAIFKREFASFFRSPVGYVFIAITILVFYGVFYLVNITGETADMSTLFLFAQMLIALIIPLLTMNLISNEYNKKTDQLLLTAPVSVLGIVLGKFFAALSVIALSLAGTLLIPVVLASIGGFQFWPTVGNYLSTFFFSAAFLAIGIFISSLTESNFISGILSWAVFIGLLVVDLMVGSYDTPFTIATGKWLAFYSRFDNVRLGIFNFSDFLFYASIAAIFLFLTSRMLEKKRYA